jgi:hypothetical protein
MTRPLFYTLSAADVARLLKLARSMRNSVAEQLREVVAKKVSK